MKKMKKFLAVILSLAMVLGMSMTAFAAKVTNQYTDDIKVTNLAQGVDTTVELLNIIYLDQDSTGNQSWQVVDWAEPYITVNTDGTYTINNKEQLRLAAIEASKVPANVTQKKEKVDTETTFTDVPVGAYVIYAHDDAGVYGLMVANTYNKDGDVYMATKTANVTAKLNKYNVTKETNDEFVHRGQTVTFTVTTQMAPKTNDEGVTLETFKIQDKPTNLQVTNLKSVSVNGVAVGTDVLAAIKAAVTNTKDANQCTTEYIVDLTSLIEGTPAGSTIEIQYEAIVMSENGYQNEATALAQTVTYDKDSTSGTEGSVAIKKVDKNGTALKGAQFELLKDTNKDGATVKEAVSVVKVSDGVYRHALDSEAGATTIMDVAADGTLKVVGLDEGTYYFHETKAPESYKLVDTPTAGKEITDGNTVTVDFGEFVNTKLSSLPSTGGMGTTLFTIAGCAIMVAAAGFFFASRKRVNK